MLEKEIPKLPLLMHNNPNHHYHHPRIIVGGMKVDLKRIVRLLGI
jgi:hypothetical protein